MIDALTLWFALVGVATISMFVFDGVVWSGRFVLRFLAKAQSKSLRISVNGGRDDV